MSHGSSSAAVSCASASAACAAAASAASASTGASSTSSLYVGGAVIAASAANRYDCDARRETVPVDRKASLIGLDRHTGKKVPDDLQGLPGLSLKKATIRWSQSSTLALGRLCENSGI